MKMRRSVGICSALAVSAVLVSESASAGQAVPLDIDAQPVSEALRDFTLQSGLQVLYRDNGAAPGHHTQRVAGTLKPEIALRSMLAGTGLVSEFVNEKTVAIRESASESSKLVAEDAPRANSDEPEAAASSQSTTAPPADGKVDVAFQDKGIPELLIRGSRSLNVDMERTRDDIQPYVVLSRESIRSSGATSVEDLLRTRLTMNYPPEVGNYTQGLPQPGVGNRSTIALRGLSAKETLILIDGRRLASGSIQGSPIQPDLNAIPLSAIERIEVLPSTASGIYGGSATGGVVNVVMRRDFTGAELGLQYENSFRNDGGNRRVDLNAGTNFLDGRTTVLFSASYSDATPIKAGDRSFYQDYITRSGLRSVELGLADFYVPMGTTANIWSDDGSNLVLKNGTSLNSQYTSSPLGYAGLSSDGGAALAQNAGRFNSTAPDTAHFGGTQRDIAGAPIVRSVDVTVRHQLSSRIELLGEMYVSRNDSYMDNSLVYVDVFLPRTNALNPFAQAINVRAPLYTDDVANPTKTGNMRGLFGVKASLGGDWSTELDLVFDRFDLYRSESAPTNFSSAFFANPRPDIFRDDSVDRTLSDYLGFATDATPTHSTQQSLSLRAAGPIWNLPAGPIVLSTLAEYRREFSAESDVLSDSGTGVLTSNRYSDQSARASSAYLEATIPIISERNAMWGVRSLSAQAAARYDKYHQAPGYLLAVPRDVATAEWSSTDPTVGLRFEPVRGFVLRASYGTGFLPPDLRDLVVGVVNTFNPAQYNLTDKRRDYEPVTHPLQSLQGGNPDLRPERSRSRSLGVIVSPAQVDNLRVSVDWTRIEKTDNITPIQVGQDVIEDEENLPGVIERGLVPDRPELTCDPVCPITRFNTHARNNARAEYESLDFSLDYRLSAGRVGEFGLLATGTRLLHSKSQFTSLTSFVEDAGYRAAPSWSAVASLEWVWRQSLSVLWTSRYVDSYWFARHQQYDDVFGSDRIGSGFYHDLSARYAFGESRVPLVSGMELRLGIRNLLDTPPRYAGRGQYDFAGGPQLRAYYVSVRAKF
jgi:iron complex outermembrane recepter protein